MKLIRTINPEGVTEEEVASYRVREAVRSVVVDANGLIGLLHVSNELSE